MSERNETPVILSERSESKDLYSSISRAQALILSQQFSDGYWWYTLEANDSIAAEYLLFHYYMNIELESWRVTGIIEQILRGQQVDGSWPLYHGGPGSVGATTECYFALKLYGFSADDSAMVKARDFILSQGGALKSWVFTRIHLAMLGILPWDAAPEMPAWLIFFSEKRFINIYEFSSWARASIVPLLVIMDAKKTVSCPITLDELFPHPPTAADWAFHVDMSPRPLGERVRVRGIFPNLLSLENAFIQFNKLLKKIPTPKILRKKAIARCERWIVEHLQVTEDIFPALMYGALSLHLLGYESKSGILAKALNALKSFQMKGNTPHHLLSLYSSPWDKGRLGGVTPIDKYQNSADFSLKVTPPNPLLSQEGEFDSLPPMPHAPTLGQPVYQQCCISPTWDTAWAGIALLDSGINPGAPELMKAARWLLKMQISTYYGDWSVKNKGVAPGGWAFEFQNDAFPDIDDTIEIMQLIDRVALPMVEKEHALARAADWVISMQSAGGGWAAFDKDNTKTWVNRIPFSDHKACLDPPTADITARVLETLVQFGYSLKMDTLQRGLVFIKNEQSAFGAWQGRWGVNYLYGTWCVLQGLATAGISPSEPFMQQGINWLMSVQNQDGGWSESCASYDAEAFIPLPHSTASQTAWAVLALIACGLAGSDVCRRGIDFLVTTQKSDGTWNETAFTGTGFPKHFYIRYHGYRHYFPLLALAKYRRH